MSINMTHSSSLLSMVFAAALSGACASEAPLQVCTDELRVQFTPVDTTILVGEGFTASVQLATCGGAVSLADAFTWHSQDPSIATVDSLTGHVIGRSAGETRVTATGKSFGSVGGPLISVRAAGP
jgi:hypothetical protein